MKCLKRVAIGDHPSGPPTSTFTFLDDDAKEVEIVAPTRAFETGKDYPKKEVLPAKKADPDGEEA